MTDAWDRLMFDYSVWTLYADGQRLPMTEPVVLRGEDHRRILAAANALQDVLVKTIEACRSTPKLLGYYRFHPDLLAMFAASRPDEPIVARFDFFLCDEGLRVSEFNTDVCAGINETQGLYDLFLNDSEAFAATRNLLTLLLRNNPRCVAFMYPTGYSDDFEQANFLRTSLMKLGVRTVYGAPVNFEFDGRRLTAFGEPVDMLYRYYLADWLAGQKTVGALLAAYRARAFDMITGFGQIVCQTKKVMAFWYDHMELFTPKERRLIESLVPRTWLYSALGREKVLRMRERVVVKRGFGNMGNEVVLGPLLDDESFSEWLDQIDREPDEWVVQEFFHVQADSRTLFPCYGAYMIDGRFSGYYTRAAYEPYICYSARVAPTRVDG